MAPGGVERTAEMRPVDSSLFEILTDEDGLQIIELAIKGLYSTLSPSSSISTLDRHSQADNLKRLHKKLETALYGDSSSAHSVEVFELPDTEEPEQ